MVFPAILGEEQGNDYMSEDKEFLKSNNLKFKVCDTCGRWFLKSVKAVGPDRCLGCIIARGWSGK